jgi:Fe2+ transport system protein FeoA
MKKIENADASEKEKLISLDAIPDDCDVVIRRLRCKSASLRQRLMELGLNVKTVVRKRSVAGGVICEIGHSRFALGRKVCRQIEVALV